MLNIFTLTEHIAAALRSELDGLTYRFKSTDEPNDATETKPRVYTFTYDGELDRDLLPVHTPSVLLQVIKRDSDVVSYLVHVYVVNASIVDDEIAIDCGDGSYRWAKCPPSTMPSPMPMSHDVRRVALAVPRCEGVARLTNMLLKAGNM